MDGRVITLLPILCIGLISSQGLPSPRVVTYLVAEEQHNAIMGHLLADAGVQPAPGSQLQLRILRGDFIQLFYIEGSSDKLMTVRPLDREQLCGKSSPCIVQLDVTVLVDFQLKWLLNVAITVMDINDHEPHFGQENTTMEIPEETDIGTTFSLPIATDRDIGDNSVQRYSFPLGSADTFSVHNYESRDGVIIPKLVLNSKLKRDIVDKYIFKLIAFDSGTPVKSGSVWITINIMQSNDHPPVFTQEVYEVSKAENSEIGHLLRIEATDLDSGQNGEVMYSFNNDMSISHDGMLTINETTGDITLLKDLDYEHKTHYRYKIYASDLANNPLRSSTELLLTVIDMNDSPPSLSIETFSQANYSVIPENAPIGTFIAIITTKDDDSGLNGEVECTSSITTFDLNPLYASDHQLALASGLDFEMQQNYTVEIACTDKGSLSLGASATLDIYISDVNDNAPRFEQLFYNTSVLENSYARSPLIRVQAYDLDSGENGRINYSIEENNARRWLSVDETSGLISTKVPFDHELEAQSQIEFSVIARDNGDPSLSATATVRLTVIDTNDEAPVFSTNRYMFQISENGPSGAVVGALSAVDKDDAPFNVIEYFIRNDTFDAKAFSVDIKNGELRTNKMLDREERPAYYFEAFARDTVSPFHTSTVAITVYVTDLNDNAPVIDFPTRGNNTIQVPFNAENNYPVTQIIASDEDADYNAKLLYTILNGNEMGCFRLDENDGTLYINSSTEISASGKDNFILNIIVEDSSNPPKPAYAILNINIDTSLQLIDGSLVTIPTNKQSTHTLKQLAYQHKITLVLGPLTIALLLALVGLLVIIKVRQRKQRDECAKFMRSEELSHLRSSHSAHSSEHSRLQDAGESDENEGPNSALNQSKGNDEQYRDTSNESYNPLPPQNDMEGGPSGGHGGGTNPGPDSHAYNRDIAQLTQDEQLANRLRNVGIQQTNDGSPADIQLYKLLRFLNEVEQNQQQMISSTTESTQYMTELSAADSGTGMSEEEHAEEFPVPQMKPIYATPNIVHTLPGSRNGLNGRYHSIAQQPTRQCDVLEPDQFYEIRGGTSTTTPKIVINTRQRPKHKSHTFNLKSPRRTLAKFKLLQSFQSGSHSSKEDTSKTVPTLHVDDPVSRRSASTDSFADTTTGSLQSMNSSQTFRNSRHPVTLGTFKPEMGSPIKPAAGQVDTTAVQLSQVTSSPIETNL